MCVRYMSSWLIDHPGPSPRPKGVTELANNRTNLSIQPTKPGPCYNKRVRATVARHFFIQPFHGTDVSDLDFYSTIFDFLFSHF